MAQIEKMIPFIIRWECGITQKPGESLPTLFERAKASKNGFVNDPDDKGGATVIGVIYNTFKTYCEKYKLEIVPSVVQLKMIDYGTWKNILQQEYWNRWKADVIPNQSVAELLVDWVWASGKWGIVIPQRILGVTDDGIVGPKTIEALLKRDPAEFFIQVYEERIAYVEGLVKKDASQKKFLQGWKNRINDVKFQK